MLIFFKAPKVVTRGGIIMVIFTEKEKLKNGEWLTIKAIKTPAEEYEDRIFSYINPKMPWRQDTYKRVNFNNTCVL